MRTISAMAASIAAALLALGTCACQLNADIVVHTQPMLAVQNVNLLGIEAVLTAGGEGTFTFEVDGNNNTIPGGASNLVALFYGFLPDEFEPLGVDGAPFELFNNPPDLVQTTGNGTFVRVETTFGLRVFVAPGVVGANFYTSVPSLFETDVVGLQDFTGSIFQDPDRPLDFTEIFVEENLLGLSPGTLVGVSFNRTVTAIPEPGSLGFLCFVAGGFSLQVFRRRHPLAAH